MSFVIMTDTSANIPTRRAAENDLTVIPFSYYINGREHTCLDTDLFNGDDYYDMIRKGVKASTSQVPPQRYIDHFEPALKEGKDIVYVSMSSGISGSCGAAGIAAGQLAEEYPERRIKVIDTLAASLGEGLVALKACEYRARGLSFEETVEKLMSMARRMFQVFTVDDLMHLRRGGRLSNLSAIVGTVLNIKPLLKGNSEGKIVAFAKVRGRKHSIRALAERYDRLVDRPEEQTIGIAQAGCRDDAEQLSELLMKNRPPKEILNVEYEPVTGSHVGPGALALFFLGKDGVREET